MPPRGPGGGTPSPRHAQRAEHRRACTLERLGLRARLDLPPEPPDVAPVRIDDVGDDLRRSRPPPRGPLASVRPRAPSTPWSNDRQHARRIVRSRRSSASSIAGLGPRRDRRRAEVGRGVALQPFDHPQPEGSLGASNPRRVPRSTRAYRGRTRTGPRSRPPHPGRPAPAGPFDGPGERALGPDLDVGWIADGPREGRCPANRRHGVRKPSRLRTYWVDVRGCVGSLPGLAGRGEDHGDIDDDPLDRDRVPRRPHGLAVRGSGIREWRTGGAGASRGCPRGRRGAVAPARRSAAGIDVSHHQGSIDWAQVAAPASASRSRRRPTAERSSTRRTRPTRPAPRQRDSCSAPTTSPGPTRGERRGHRGRPLRRRRAARARQPDPGARHREHGQAHAGADHAVDPHVARPRHRAPRRPPDGLHEPERMADPDRRHDGGRGRRLHRAVGRALGRGAAHGAGARIGAATAGPSGSTATAARSPASTAA